MNLLAFRILWIKQFWRIFRKLNRKNELGERNHRVGDYVTCIDLSRNFPSLLSRSSWRSMLKLLESDVMERNTWTLQSNPSSPEKSSWKSVELAKSVTCLGNCRYHLWSKVRDNVMVKWFKQGKKVCKTTAFRCYQYFSLRLLLFLASRTKWLPDKKASVLVC